VDQKLLGPLDHFTLRIFEKYQGSDEIRLIFDRYDLPSSLKEATRPKRQGNATSVYYHITPSTHIAKVTMKKPSVYYHITPSTHIAKVTMKKLLSHVNTKKELTEYFAQKIIETAQRMGRNTVVSWACECKGSTRNMTYLKSNQEEADTKIILHALDATTNGATEIKIHSPDTDVFILALRRFPRLCQNTVFATGKGENRREIQLKPIVDALGPIKTAALPAFHALSGADNTGSFSGKGKASCWKAIDEASEDVFHAISSLGTSDMPSDETVTAIEWLVCQFFLPKTDISTVTELRWWLFKKKQAQSERLPPTFAALYQAILRSHYQLLVWNNDDVSNPALPSPSDFGWKWEEDEKSWTPVMTTLPPAPNAIVHLVRCNCQKQRCSNNRCQCRKASLNCTELCGCCDNDGDCENMVEDNQVDWTDNDD
jgi:hypothetical protein